MHDARRRRLGLAAAATCAGALATTVLGGCGFQLRQPPRLAFGSIALLGFAPRSPLAEELKRQLARQVRVLDSPAKADLVLQAEADLRERSIVASTAAAQVRAVQLRVRLIFSVRTPGGREPIPRAELLAARDLSYSETAALAKEEEESALYRDMQADIVAQVLRRLASVSV